MDTDVTGASTPEPTVAVIRTDDDCFTDADLIEHAEAGLAEALDVMGRIEDAIAVAGEDESRPSDQLPAINPTYHAVASLAASAALTNRLLARIVTTLERGFRLLGDVDAMPSGAGDTRVQP